MSDDLRDQLQVSLGRVYTIERELGGGGMSRVFVAEETRFHRRVVIKVLSPELAAGLSAERFEREIALAAGLQQANIVPVLTAGTMDVGPPGRGGSTTGGVLPWYAMPYVDGESLRARLTRPDGAAAVPLGESVAILRDVARALAYAHGRGIVHRDIKPENVLLSGGAAVVTDFGIAKALAASRTQAPGGTLTVVGTSLGTPAYMAPEQAAGDDVDHRADLYAWGVMAYELLSAKHPFAGKTTAQQLIAAHIAEAPRPLTESVVRIPSALGALVMRCLEKDPARRPQSASELLAALDTVVTPSHETTTADDPVRGRRRRIIPLVAGFALLAAALLWMLVPLVARRGAETFTDASAAAGMRSIAVLPFVNVGGDTAQEFFADGMTEEISGVLAKIPNLRVAGRRSAFVYKGKSVSAKEIGKALGVALLLDGQVRREGNQVRVTAQLTDAANDTRRWNGKWQVELKDAFQVQDYIAQAIAGELRLALGGSALAASRAGRTANPVAHDLYLRGRAHLNRGSEPELRTAITLFQEALAADPDFAQAHAGIAAGWSFLADAYVPSREAYPHARDAALAALRIDSLLADAHATYGYALMGTTMDIPAAERELRRAEELDPNSFYGTLFYANLLCAVGRSDEGLVYAEKAIKLEPLSVIGSWNREVCLYCAGRWDEVIAQHQRTVQLDSTFVYVDAFHAAALREKGQYDQAVAEYERAQRLLGGQPLYGLAITYARMGRGADARRVMQALEERARREYIAPDALAMGYAGIGDADRAFAWLRRAVDEHSALLIAITTWPELDSIRSDPRFAAILRALKSP